MRFIPYQGCNRLYIITDKVIKMEVNSLTLWEYLMMDAEMHTSLSDHYMYAMKQGLGAALSLRENGQIVSYAIFKQENNHLRMHYIYTRPNMRRKGYATKLISHIQDQSKCKIVTTINKSIEYSDAIISCLIKLNFKESISGCIYTATVDSTMWDKMDNLKILKIKELLLRDNAVCIPFKDMDASAREQLLNSPHNEFDNTLNPAPFLTNNARRADSDFSTIMLKDGILCSYVIITRPDRDTVCFEQISETHSKIGTGSIIAPMCCALERIRECPEIKRLTLHIQDNNQRSVDFFLSMFSRDELRISHNASYTSY